MSAISWCLPASAPGVGDAVLQIRFESFGEVAQSRCSFSIHVWPLSEKLAREDWYDIKIESLLYSQEVFSLSVSIPIFLSLSLLYLFFPSHQTRPHVAQDDLKFPFKIFLFKIFILCAWMFCLPICVSVSNPLEL